MTVQEYIACILSAPLHFSESRHLWGKIYPITNIKTRLIYLTFPEKCAYIQSQYPHLLCMCIILYVYITRSKKTPKYIKVHLDIAKYTPFHDIYYKKLYTMYAVIESNQHSNSSHFKSTF